MLSAFTRLLRESTVTQILLGPLAAADIQALIATVGTLDKLSSETQTNIARRSEGNPFFAIELAKYALSTRDGTRRERLPLSIRASVFSRLTKLSADDRRVIAYAAVIGYRFDPAVLAVVMERTIDALTPSLSRARDLQLITDEGVEPGQCRFQHALTQHVIYDDLLTFDVRRIHARVLETLELLPNRDAYLRELAEHAWIAGDVQKTVHYNERAAEEAYSVAALPEAAACFSRAVEVVVEEKHQLQLLDRLVTTLQSDGKYERAIATLRFALDIRIKRAEWDESAAIIGYIIGEVANSTGERDTQLADDFLRQHEADLSGAALGRLLAFLARLASAANDFDTVEKYVARIPNLDQLAPRALQNYYIAQLNWHAYRGRTSAWKSVAQACSDVLATLDDPLLAAIGYFAIAQTGCYLRADGEVVAALCSGERLVARHAFVGLAAFGAAIRGTHLYLRGRLKEAKTCIMSALETPDVAVARNVVATFGTYVALELGDEVLARRCLDSETVDEMLKTPGIHSSEVLAARAALHGANGSLSSARADLRRAIVGVSCDVPSTVMIFVIAGKYLAPQDVEAMRTCLVEVSPENDMGAANAALLQSIFESSSGTHSAIAAATATMHFRECDRPLFEAYTLELGGDAAESERIRIRCGAHVARSLESIGVGGTLSERERQIADCVTEGLTNLAIAVRLSIRPKTVEKHLTSIFSKLGVSSRSQLAALIARGDISAPLRR